ncbi:MAG: hemin receptor [Hyphomicrobiaceae bacterium]|nr:hemin receptor [Hyphomicrobiaceae bacterium]
MADAAQVNEAVESAREPQATSPVSAENIRVLRETYLAVEPASDLVATLFFRRLDEIAPEVRPFLGEDINEQRKQLLISLGLAVAALDRFDDIIPALKLLGSKYRTMGVTELHYGAVGEALIWTLKQSLGSKWSADAEDAWTGMCTLIGEVMTAAK